MRELRELFDQLSAQGLERPAQRSELARRRKDYQPIDPEAAVTLYGLRRQLPGAGDFDGRGVPPNLSGGLLHGLAQ